MSEELDLLEPVQFSSADERRAAIKFFNAAYRAEQSGITQAHQLAGDVAEWDSDLAEVLRLYGDEEGWHQELLTRFLGHLGGDVMPMGRVTSLLFNLYARAKRRETIVLTNLLFETIGATTYRMALSHAEHPAVRQMLTILTRDESFHVPLNVFFLRNVLERSSRYDRARLRVVHKLMFLSLLLLPLSSRPKSKAFDRLGTLDLVRAYGRQMALLFLKEDDLPFEPPWLVLGLLGIRKSELQRSRGPSVVGEEAAEGAADRRNVVTAL